MFNSMDLPWQLLEEITDSFSDEREIGRGGYGVVYKGVYKTGEEIAVKKLYHWLLDDKQFQNELEKLTILCHQNIVRLVGKSYEERPRCVEHKGKLVCAIMIDRAICLEYLRNGSLEKHLYDEYSGHSWHRRYEIIKGICDGLKYLHDRGIFHLDLKPANILLDKNMVPKIADFDLSRLFSGTRQSHTTGKSIGTLGYMPPEYIEKGKITDKFDVFSLGVIIIGIMTGPKGYSDRADMQNRDFIEQVVKNWRNRLQEQWKDKSYLDVLCQQVNICIEIALNCVEPNRDKRPGIGDIMRKLNESETMIEKSDKVLARGHPTEPWILTNHGATGTQILNYRTQVADLQMDNELDNASDELDNASEMPADLPYHLLEEITNGFSEERKIGSGGYGVVYKGVYKNGEEIAVKKLYHMPGLDDKQFQIELRSLTRLRHKNIVRLVGKSYEERDRCIEYEGKLVCAKMIDRVICLEYLHNGSLEKHLSDESFGLPWHRRYEIIKGICDGLKYLHECGIFHLDLKPANILLDKNMVPKVADFGLSRLFSGTRQSHTTWKFLGTIGYMPPEYIKQGKISNKFDVFSLGVIIIGIITGPDGYFKQSDMSSQDFIEQVLENWSNRPQEQWKDAPYIDVFCQLKICIEIALNCVETDRHKRPTIGDIICKLNESETMIEKSDKVLARGFFCTIDVHPTEPWILTNRGYTGIQILNYRTQATVKSWELKIKFSGGYGPVKTAKFIARKQWFVIGGWDGSIRVYCYRALQEVKCFVAHSCWVSSLAIHPTEPYVLSASDNGSKIKLWDWEKCWECTRIFEVRSWVHRFAFNPKDTNSFATGYVDGRAEIWNLGSPDSSFTLDENEHTRCMLDYFASGDRQYLITASSDDYAAKIWDLQKKSCIKTLGHEEGVTAVCSHPELPILMTASDGIVYLWNSTTFRVQRTFNFGLGEVLAFGCIKGSRRVVIGHIDGLAMI